MKSLGGRSTVTALSLLFLIPASAIAGQRISGTAASGPVAQAERPLGRLVATGQRSHTSLTIRTSRAGSLPELQTSHAKSPTRIRIVTTRPGLSRSAAEDVADNSARWIAVGAFSVIPVASTQNSGADCNSVLQQNFTEWCQIPNTNSVCDKARAMEVCFEHAVQAMQGVCPQYLIQQYEQQVQGAQQTAQSVCAN